MRRTDTWLTSQINQNAVLKTANMAVVSQFGSDAPSAGEARKKHRKDMKFIVGETKVGGEEVV
jgi:hypothetical protein